MSGFQVTGGGGRYVENCVGPARKGKEKVRKLNNPLGCNTRGVKEMGKKKDKLRRSTEIQRGEKGGKPLNFLGGKG